MEALTKAAWFSLALIHMTPALVLFAPGLLERLYGIPSTGDLGLLLTHRGGLFLAVCIASVFAAISPDARKLASLVVGISMISFLIIYLRAGLPEGPMRKIAITDFIGLIPLIFVTWRSWA